MTDTALALRQYVGAFVDELALAGVTDVVICPGSRSTPLAMLIHEHPNLKTWMHLDERSAAFFALGISKATRRPAAVVCTSGTAAANFMPAVVEAHFGQTPLLVLTADRPQELRDVGALQTIDQVRLYGTHAKRFEEMLLPEATPMAVRHARATADRAVATALTDPRGPVHLNFPFREPLIPGPPAAPFDAGTTSPHTAIEAANRLVTTLDHESLEARLRNRVRGLIVCGPMPFSADELGFDITDSIRDLAATRHLPILADGLSQYRSWGADEHVLDQFDSFLRDATFASLGLDYVLRIGEMPVSKPLQQYLERNSQAAHIVVGSRDTWPDAMRIATHMSWGDTIFATESIRVLKDAMKRTAGGAEVAAQDPVERERVAWFELWRRANEVAAIEIESALATQDRMSEPLVFRRMAELVPEDSIVFAGNSMPVRDLDSFWPASTKQVRFLANRGASGIDGVVSTALGVAATSGKPTTLVIGDISLYHDMNGLFAAKRHGLKATIVVINNDGGGIFSFLPQAEKGEGFEELFGTPHGLDFRHAADLYGLVYALAGTPDEFDAAFMKSMDAGGVTLIEVRTNRDENLALHRDIWARVAGALARDREATPR